MPRPHGRLLTYQVGCRCDRCREAGAVAAAAAQEHRRQRLEAGTATAEHGKANTYKNWGCRCLPCTAANSARSAGYKRGRRGKS